MNVPRPDRLIRALPSVWRRRLPLAGVLTLALALGGLGGVVLELDAAGRAALWQERTRTAALSELSLRAGRVEAEIHQYLVVPDEDLLKQTTRAGEDLLVAISDVAGSEAAPDEEVAAMQAAARRFLAAFQAVRRVDADIAGLLESRIGPVLDEMSGRYALLEAAMPGGASLAEAVGPSHQAFVAALTAIDALARDGRPGRAEAARERLARLVASFAPLAPRLNREVERDGLATLRARAAELAAGVEALAADQAERRRLLAQELGPGQAALAQAADRLIERGRAREAALSARIGDRLALVLAVGGAGLVLLLGLGGWLVRGLDSAVRRPLVGLRARIEAGLAGEGDGPIALDGDDEVAALARALEAVRRQGIEQRRVADQRAEEASRVAAASRHLLEEVLARVEAAAAEGQGLPDGLVPDSVEAGIARSFERLLARARAEIATRDADLAALTAERAAAEAAARDRSALLLALILALRGPLQRGEPAWPLLERIEAALDCCRLDRGEAVIDRVAAEPEAVIVSALAVARAGAGADPARLTAWADPGLPRRCLLDPARLSRLVCLLIDHAAAGGGRVRLAAERLGPDEAPLLRLWVVGEGRPPATAEAGPDLAIEVARQLACRLGGRFEASADPAATGGVGCLSWCLLPLWPLPPAAPDPGAAAPAEAGRLMGARVLVVAADADERRLVAQVAEQAGAAVVRVPGGREAIAAVAKANLSRAPFDLAIAAAAVLAPDQLAALGPAPLLLIDDEATPPPRRAVLQAGDGWVGALGRPLAPSQLLAAMARAVAVSPPATD
ncbi:hypothetical protein [Phaeospirillum tilakii]|uniref:HAMP domain-containing protein n=1 Tax=Phaeospirillum tilakii TaxID=741673 RepID=A0ABW5CCK1_9PROT